MESVTAGKCCLGLEEAQNPKPDWSGMRMLQCSCRWWHHTPLWQKQSGRAGMLVVLEDYPKPAFFFIQQILNICLSFKTSPGISMPLNTLQGPGYCP